MVQQIKLTALIIEDNIAIAENIADYLEALGYTLDFANNGKQGLELALNNYYDVIVLDLMLPKMDGLQVCSQLRILADRHIPVLMLTARDTLADKVIGFEAGADDYLTKPFALEELHIRCLALSKRNRVQKNNIFELGDLQINFNSQQVVRQGHDISLPLIPYKILLVLAESYPSIVSRSELCSRIWGDNPTDSDTIRSHVYQLRQALDKPFNKSLLKTIHGVGFKLEVDND